MLLGDQFLAFAISFLCSISPLFWNHPGIVFQSIPRTTSSLRSRFQAMGSAQLIRMDVDDDEALERAALRTRWNGVKNHGGKS